MSDATDAIAKYQTAIDLYRAGVRFSAAEFMAMPPEEQAIFAAAGDAVEKSRTEALAASISFSLATMFGQSPTPAPTLPPREPSSADDDGFSDSVRSMLSASVDAAMQAKISAKGRN